MKGEVVASWQLHPLGGFALAVILYRIFEIIKNLQTKHNYG
jgi:phosphate/sulfate permease